MQASPEIEVEDTVIIILKDGVEVARGEADDWEEPSSLSAFYRATGSGFYEVKLSSRIDDTILANGLQIAAKVYETAYPTVTNMIPMPCT